MLPLHEWRIWAALEVSEWMLPSLSESSIDQGKLKMQSSWEVVKYLGAWKTADQFGWETMSWLHWYNKDRLHGANG